MAKFNNQILKDFDRARELEWLETNGIGGYASSTASGAHSRRYHGLLVGALQPPVGRTVLLSKLDETIVVPDRDSKAPLRYELGANQYPGAVHPKGYQLIKSFEKDLFPVFTYSAGGVEIKKTIACVQGENTTLVLYEIVKAPAEITLELLPLYSARDYHSLSRANDRIGTQYLFENGVFQTMNYEGGTEIFISVPDSEFQNGPGWYYNFEYVVEKSRGFDYSEDLFTHGKFTLTAKKGDKVGVIISTQNPLGKNAWTLFAAESQRRQKLVLDFSWDDNIRRLVLAADQFIVKRGSLSTIIAGYHWFADWGRDTMITLPGLCLSTGRFKEAKQILQQFAGSVSEGMLPNRFPDLGESPEYNTIDATLWFFYAILRYYRYTGDKEFVKSMLPVLIDIIEWHYNGTRYNIKVDPTDELLAGGQQGVQLTWMDAKVGDWVVTPRRGKAVEINALWYNALKSLEYFVKEVGVSADAKKYGERAARVFKSFNEVFWNEASGFLFDCIDGSSKAVELRPNQLFALSLPFQLVDNTRALSILDAVTKELLTSRGLRTLAPSAAGYRPTYSGDVWMRDGAYHQGTVWSFLFGAYIDALLNTSAPDAEQSAIKIINDFLAHLDEAGVGTISEIFDAAQPHCPHGCIAQGWGVGEILRVILEHNLFPKA